MKRNPVKMLNRIAQVIYDKKGSNILALDLKGLCSITDYLLIAEGNVDRHVISIAKAIMEDFKESPIHIEGLANGDWVVLDFSDVIVHLFQPGLREKYSLEKLWKEGQIVDLAIDVSAHRAVGFKY
jgi:ribosome-associated protein